jgi:nucleotide-binding universal stress UspA family protein
MSMPSILCGVDFTSASKEALRVAVEEVKLRDGILDLVHVWYPVDPVPVDMSGIGLPVYDAELPAELQQQLNAIEVDLPNDRVRRYLETGPVADEIVRKAEELGSSLLVVGTHSRGPLMRWFVGSIATDLLRMSPCPILVCRTPHPTTDDSTDTPQAIDPS